MDKHPEVEETFTIQYVKIGNYFNSLPEEAHKCVVINKPERSLYGISMSAQTPMFIEKTKFLRNRAEYIRFEELDRVIIIPGEKTVIIPMYPENSTEELANKFPGEIISIENGVQSYEIN